ncbi:MAG: alanine--tRNA ligase, partial [Candidatus Helarchaeota archaeon]
VVDVGWGVERVGWFATRTPTVYEATFGPVLAKMKDIVGIEIDQELLNKYYVLSGLLNVDEVDIKVERKKVAEQLGIDYIELEKTLGPLEALYAIADHLRTLVFTISDGAIPSNVGGGYNLRAILRRAINLKEKNHFDNLNLLEICHWHINYLKKTYKGVKNAEDSIDDIFQIEQERYYATLKKNRTQVNNLIKKKVVFDLDKLIELYQSNGILPELVEEIAAEQGVRVEIPPDFFTRLMERNIQTKKQQEITLEEKLKDFLKDISDTRLLYYEDQYLDSCEAIVLKILPENNVVLNQTIFYPLGGGQVHDIGTINEYPVINVEKIGGIVVHQLGKKPSKLKKGEKVQLKIDKVRRMALMRHHTATHVVNGAAKRVLGKHVWQAGAEKKPEVARLDITHYKSVTQDEIWEIERLANQIVMETRPVNIQFMSRGEAEAKYGFTLYQGGIVPGKEIRVIDIQDWDVEACGGTHLKNTGEIGPIKILSAQRIQDGIVRLTYSAGMAAVTAIQRQEKLLKEAAKPFDISDSEVPSTIQRFFNERNQFKKERDKIRKQLISIEKVHLLENAFIKNDLKIVIELFSEKSIEDLRELGRALTTEDPSIVAILGAINEKINLIIVLGSQAIDKGLHAGNLIRTITKEVGGGGGGKLDLGQGGGIPKMELEDFKEVALSKILNECKNS